MDSSTEPSQSPLVVFGLDHIDTSRAEMLVQCLNEKIKEKRYKLQKMIGINEEKKKRNEMMKNEKIQLTTKLTNTEGENSVREQQLVSEQARIKELQYNIQMLDDHNNSIKRDCTNEEHKYEQEKSTLIKKFEHTKQQWTEIFKPQYEQSKVYRYLKQGDTAYNSLVERKETLLKTQKSAYKDYLLRRQEFCGDKNLQLSILAVSKYFICRRDQLMKIQQMKEKLFELENKHAQLTESKMDKMKAWESVYTQPVKRDLMDFCLQTNIDQALTLSFNQIQQDIWSQPMTPIAMGAAVLTPQNEQVELVPETPTVSKSSISFQPSISIDPKESVHQVVAPSMFESTASTITIVPNPTKTISMETNRPSVLHLTTAIDDDDDELFSTSRRKIPISQLEQMSINDGAPSTQVFVVPSTVTSSNINVDREVSFMSPNDQPLTQVFTTGSTAPPEATTARNLVTPTLNAKLPEPVPNLSIDNAVTKLHSTVTFSLPSPSISNRSVTSIIQPQVTSNDVQQMLLTFSPDPSSINEEQPQPMEEGSEQSQQQQQRPTFSMASSIESTASTEEGYAGFNYNFGFNSSAAGDGATTGGRDFTSPINFSNWTDLTSPVTTGSNDQFSAFLQQTNGSDHNVDTSFSFSSFNYGDLGDVAASSNGAFSSFFFGNNINSMNQEQTPNDKST